MLAIEKESATLVEMLLRYGAMIPSTKVSMYMKYEGCFANNERLCFVEQMTIFVASSSTIGGILMKAWGQTSIAVRTVHHGYEKREIRNANAIISFRSPLTYKMANNVDTEETLYVSI